MPHDKHGGLYDHVAPVAAEHPDGKTSVQARGRADWPWIEPGLVEIDEDE